MPVYASADVRQLRSGGVCIVLDTTGRRMPSVLYWGPDLGVLSEQDLESIRRASLPPLNDSEIDIVATVGLVPSPTEGWTGTPGLSGSRHGSAFSPAFALVTLDEFPTVGSATGLSFEGVDEHAKLRLRVDVELTPSGLLRARAHLLNEDEESSYHLERLLVTLPVPTQASVIMDMTGRHARERVTQRTEFNVGTHLRESRKGKPGLDASYLLAAGTNGFDYESGEVWALHVGWSGNQLAFAERTFNGHSLVGGGELLLPGEIELASRERYSTPWIHASYGKGLNEMAARFHDYLRSRPVHPTSPRPVVLNTWEAVYYDQNIEALLRLAEAGAAVGAERFVLDDGWFKGRRDDRRALGDWYVDDTVWPSGLGVLIDKVHGLGMDFGLWVEPEMISLDSDLARAHPEWIFQPGERLGLPSRYQHVLDLGHPGAYEYIRGRLRELLATYDIAYLKWDHNRMVVEAGHTPTGRPGVHQQTLAVYRLMEDLRREHPQLEIETCAGGGGRIDLGILEHTDRVWPSDCIDALDRQEIVRGTQLLVPPELIGTHVGSPEAHSTRRTHHLSFRAASAIWGHMGIEWDLGRATAAELAELTRWVDLYKDIRGLLHRGRAIVIDHPDSAIWVNGVIAHDRSEAVFGITTVDRSVTWPPGRVRLSGLDPDEHYFLQPLAPGDIYPESTQLPPWWHTGTTLTGRVLADVGIQIPAMFPQYTHLLRATASDS